MDEKLGRVRRLDPRRCSSYSLKVSPERVNSLLALISSSIEGEGKKKGVLGKVGEKVRRVKIHSRRWQRVALRNSDRFRTFFASRIFPARYLSLDAFPRSVIPPREASPRSFRSAFAEMQSRKSSVDRLTGRISIL